MSQQTSADGPSTDPDAPDPPPRRRRGRLSKALLVLLTMVLIVLLAVVGFALYLNHEVDSNVRHSSMLPDDGNRPAATGEARNILLLGSDSRTKDLDDASRADVIQLVHITGNRKSVQVIHFPRDMYVPIPGHGRNKINAAYAYGGSPLLVRTLEQMLDVRIDHVAAIGFDGFKQLTDTVGGVDVNVDQASDENGYSFTPGVTHMDGARALAFVRERHQLKEGDLDRGRRQQAWMRALMDKSISRGTLSNPTKLAGMVGDVSRNLVVDDGFTTGQMRSLAWSLRSVRGNDVTFRTAPISGFRNVQGAGSVDVVDEPALRRLGAALRKDTVDELSGGTSNPG